MLLGRLQACRRVGGGGVLKTTSENWLCLLLAVTFAEVEASQGILWHLAEHSTSRISAFSPRPLDWAQVQVI